MDADHRVEPEERDGHGWIVEVDLAALEGRHQSMRQGVDVDHEPERQRHVRTDSGPDSSPRLSFDRLVQAQGAAPERLVAEGVEPEGLAPFLDQPARGPDDRVDASFQRARLGHGLILRAGNRRAEIRLAEWIFLLAGREKQAQGQRGKGLHRRPPFWLVREPSTYRGSDGGFVTGPILAPCP